LAFYSNFIWQPCLQVIGNILQQVEKFKCLDNGIRNKDIEAGIP